jgi:hypothetical protein
MDLVRHARFRAEKKRVAFDLSAHIDEIQKLIDNGLCEVTGLPLNLDGGRTWDSPSLDRIVPAAGYLYSNIRIVCHAVNGAMGDWGEQKMVEMALAILGKRKQASDDLSMRLGDVLRKNLEGHGSTLYKLTWSLRDTPAGHRFWQQRASAPRISDRDCTGWPTAAARDWRDGRSNQHEKNSRPLNEVAMLAGWPTPVANDDNKTPDAHLAMKLRMGERDGTGARRTAITSLQVMAQTVSGPTLSGYPAPTEKRGQLNPAFPLWLQGLPAEWESFAPSGILCARRSRKPSSNP